MKRLTGTEGVVVGYIIGDIDRTPAPIIAPFPTGNTLGIRAEDNIISCGIIAARDEE